MFIIFFITVLVTFLTWFDWSRRYFERHGVKSIPFYVPFFGNLWRNVLQKEHIKDTVDKTYKSFSNQKYVGFHQLIQRVIIIKDLDLIKQLFVKDFDYFHNRASLVDESVDPILGGNIIALKGEKWRDMRSTISPAFTSSKMRGMFQFIEDCALQTVDYFKNEAKKSKNGVYELEMNDAFKKYANDVVASSVFGLKVNSYVEPDNPFFSTGKKATDFAGLKFLKFMMAAVIPGVFRALNITVMDKPIMEYYRRLIKGTMKDREDNHIIRPDMVHLLMEAQKGSLVHDGTDEKQDTGFATTEESTIGKSTTVKRKWSDDDIIAQAVLFLIAGFDTSAGGLSFMVQELVENPDVQTKLQAEIDEVTQNLGGNVTYTDLNKMVYMDMVVSETLRKWPPLVFIDRKCVKEYILTPPNDASGVKYKVNVGDSIMVPVFSMHRDPQYYPNPEKFDPERFSETNKKNIKPYSYLPFGTGPRNCIGSRFALLIAKVIMFHLLKNFDFVATTRTEIPPIIYPAKFFVTTKNGINIGFKLRSNIK